MSFRILKALSSQLFVHVFCSENIPKTNLQIWWHRYGSGDGMCGYLYPGCAKASNYSVRGGGDGSFLFGLSSYSWQWFYHQNHQRHAIVIRIPTKIRGFSIKWFRSQKLCQIFNTVEVSEATEYVTDGIYMADAHTHTQSSMAVSLWLSLCQKVVKFRAVRSLFIFMYIQQINMSCIFKFAKFYRGEYFTI